MSPKIIKIASGEITNYQLLSEIDINKERIILSTGMSNIGEIVNACNVIAKKKFWISKIKEYLLKTKKFLIRSKKSLQFYTVLLPIQQTMNS